MPDVATKNCSQCHATKNRETDFGVDASSPDGRRATCKVCFASKRSAKLSAEEKRLKIHGKTVAEAKRRLAQPQDLSVGEIHKLDQIVRLDEERLAKLQTKVDEQRKAAEHAKQLAATSPSLERIRAQFYWGAFSQSHEDFAQMVVEMKAALPSLAGPADELALGYLTKLIASVEEWITEQAERETEKAADNQEVIDGQACQSAADAIHGKFGPLFGEGVSTLSKDKLKTLFQVVREKAQQQHKTIKSDEVTATGANRKKISSRILEELTAIASRLGTAGTEVGAHQSLANAQSLDWGQATSAHAMRAYVRQLTARLEEARTTMTPEEYQKKYLELPAAPKEKTVVWRARLLNGTEQWFWPSGGVVRRGGDVSSAEIVKDARLGWVLAPSPVGAEFEDENKPVGKLEWVQEDDSSWVKKVVDPDERWEQHDDSTWHKVAGSDSPWSKPEKIVFKIGPAQPDALHSEFRMGNWWTLEDVQKAEHGPMLENPPQILPRLERTKADSIAVEPPMTKEELAKWSREPSRWKRHEEREKFLKEQKAAMLRGVFMWDKNQAAQ